MLFFQTEPVRKLEQDEENRVNPSQFLSVKMWFPNKFYDIISKMQILLQVGALLLDKSTNGKTDFFLSLFENNFFDYLKVGIFCVMVFLVLTEVIFLNASVPTNSMANTISADDRHISFRFYYDIFEPKRFDVVVCRFPDDTEKLLVKRIIGLPNETLQIINGEVYINNSETPLDEPYLSSNNYSNIGPLEIPDGHYFMMGDNRDDSWDARYWFNQFVPFEDILGRVIFKYYTEFKYFIE